MSQMVGGFSDAKTDAETLATFSAPEIVAGVASSLGKAVEKITAISYKSQVVAGVKYKVHAKVHDGTSESDVIITIFKPLPHTGNPSEVQSVVQGSEL